MADDTKSTPTPETYTVTKGGPAKNDDCNPPKPGTKRDTWTDGTQTLVYDMTAEALPIHEDDGTLIGHMFALSYVTDQQDKTDRPVTFLWNGGPGGASMMVNMGGMGPKCVPADGMNALACPQEPVDNPYTLLPSSDLVFLDAFGTGYSYVAKDYDAKKVWGVDGDADAFARGIAEWMSAHSRWNTPLYIYGESYGTFRNAVLMRVLGEKGIGVTGVIEQSTILDYAYTLSGNDLYYMGMVPVFAAGANYFGKAGKDVDQFEWFQRACDWVEGTYGPALIKVDSITPEEEDRVAGEMAELIGLKKSYILRQHLRIELDSWRKHVMRDEGLFTGRYDVRFTEPAYMRVQGDNEFFAGEDPSMDAINSPYTTAWMKLVESTGYQGSPNYVGLSFTVNMDWNFTHTAPGTMGSPQCPNVAYDMATALRRNPKCRVCFFGGIHDAATPFWNVKHAMGKLFLPPALQERIEYHLHENGHMAYADLPALKAMAPELKAFYEKRHEDKR